MVVNDVSPKMIGVAAVDVVFERLLPIRPRLPMSGGCNLSAALAACAASAAMRSRRASAPAIVCEKCGTRVPCMVPIPEREVVSREGSRGVSPVFGPVWGPAGEVQGWGSEKKKSKRKVVE